MKHPCANTVALLVLALGTPFSAVGAGEKQALTAEETAASPVDGAKKQAALKTLPFQARVAGVDPAAKTFTAKNKDGKVNLFIITDLTRIEKADGSAGTLADIKADGTVRGTRSKLSEGRWEAVKVIIGAKDTSTKNPTSAAAGVRPVEKK